MRNRKKGIPIASLESEISKLMEEYASDVASEMKKEAKKIARETVKDLQVTSPEGEGSQKGHYKDSWKTTTETENTNAISVRIYNEKKPGLTHLLEKGHAKRGGGRTRAFPHIALVESWAKEEYEKRLKERLSK